MTEINSMMKLLDFFGEHAPAMQVQHMMVLINILAREVRARARSDEALAILHDTLKPLCPNDIVVSKAIEHALRIRKLLDDEDMKKIIDEWRE